jgi:hypothetical protein
MAINYANNPWAPWLEETPDALYRALIPQNKGGGFYDYWKSRSNDVYGGYMGALGQQALGGLAPSMSFGDYLNNFKWSDFFNQSPSQRGERVPSSMMWNLR